MNRLQIYKTIYKLGQMWSWENCTNLKYRAVFWVNTY